MYAKVGNFVSSTLVSPRMYFKPQFSQSDTTFSWEQQLRKPRTRHPLLLPPEIILLILHHMSTADAVQVALASFHMKVMAEEHMYRHVNLSNCRVRTALFLSTLQQRPELGSLIETISVYKRPIPIIFKPEVHFSSLTQERFREVLLPSLWNQLLCAASRLRAIDVTLDTYDLFLENPELNDQHVRHLATASDRLETLAFHWWTYSKTTYKPRAPIPYAAIGRLLGYHASLTHLEISGLKKIDPLLGTDLPNLHTIIAHCNVVAAIIPGRPIRSITAFHHAPSGDDEINIHGVYSKFTKSTAPITYLKIDLFSGASVSAEANTIETLMQYLAGVLPHVEHLAFETDARYNTRLDHAVSFSFTVLLQGETHTCVNVGLCSHCPSQLSTHPRVFNR